LLQVSTITGVLKERIKSSRKLRSFGFWLYKASVAMCEEYKELSDSISFTFLWCCFSPNLWSDPKLVRSADFIEERAKIMPQEGNTWDGLKLRDPVYYVRSTLSQVKVTKVFASGHAPCLMELQFKKKRKIPKKIVFKDDDLRPDLMVVTICQIFNELWSNSGLEKKPHILTFGLNFLSSLDFNCCFV